MLSLIETYARQPMRDLLAAETAELHDALKRCVGRDALQVSTMPHDVPPALARLHGWVRLRLNDTGYVGAVRARTDEALPFRNDTFDLIVLKHVLEVVSSPREVLSEMARVLAPGGVLALTGVHPWSGWLPWWLWQRRSLPPPPALLRQWLPSEDLQFEGMRRVGAMLPWMESQQSPFLGGGYLLLARKLRVDTLLQRSRRLTLTQPISHGLASGARRST